MVACWIPLFSTGEPIENVECRTCRSAYHAANFDRAPTDAAAFRDHLGAAVLAVTLTIASVDGNVDASEIERVRGVVLRITPSSSCASTGSAASSRVTATSTASGSSTSSIRSMGTVTAEGASPSMHRPLDRPGHEAAHVVQTDGDSFRLKEATAGKGVIHRAH
jgi:hypothetical protein